MSYRSALGAALAVAAAAVAVGAVSSPPRVPVVQPAASVVPVPQIDLGCPQVPRRADTTVLAAVPPVQTPADGTLQLLVAPPRAGEPPPEQLAHGRLLRHSVLAEDGRKLLVSARGGYAPGAVAGLAATSAGRGRAAGLSTGWCTAAASDWWFTGVATSVGRTSRLTLTNPSRAPAVIDLAIFGSRGAVGAPGARGITVPGQSQRSLDLASFVPGANALALHIFAERGAVSAAVHTFALSGRTPVGADWLAPSAPPSTDLVVGPAAASIGRQELVLANPGSREALAAIQIFDADGAFTPTKLTSVRIAPGAVVVTDVASILHGQPVTVSVGANVPLTGAVTTIKPGEGPDFATVGATLPLTGPATVPLVPFADLKVMLTTTEAAGGSVVIEVYDRRGDRLRSRHISVSGRSTQPWRLPRHRSGAFVVISPRQGAAVHAVAYFYDAYGVAALPVVAGTRTVRLPVVQPAP